MVGSTVNLISGTHYSCEMREYTFMVLHEYTIISPNYNKPMNIGFVLKVVKE